MYPWISGYYKPNVFSIIFTSAHIAILLLSFHFFTRAHIATLLLLRFSGTPYYWFPILYKVLCLVGSLTLYHTPVQAADTLTEKTQTETTQHSGYLSDNYSMLIICVIWCQRSRLWIHWNISRNVWNLYVSYIILEEYCIYGSSTYTVAIGQSRIWGKILLANYYARSTSTLPFKIYAKAYILDCMHV